MQHSELVRLGAEFLRTKIKCPIVVCEMKTYANIEPDAMGFKPGEAYLIEAKASITDFNADKRKWHFGRQKADRQWYIVPEGMIDIKDVPANWGLLYATEDGEIEEVLSRPLNLEYGGSSLDAYLLYSLLRRHGLVGVFSKDNCFKQKDVA